MSANTPPVANDVKRYEIRSSALAELLFDGETCVLMVFAKDYDQLWQKCDELEKSLLRYGRHQSECLHLALQPCTCGFDAALRATP